MIKPYIKIFYEYLCDVHYFKQIDNDLENNIKNNIEIEIREKNNIEMIEKEIKKQLPYEIILGNIEFIFINKSVVK